MGSAEVTLGVHAREEEAFQPRKRFKTSELPLNAGQRSTIDALLHTIKKKGEYDMLRKRVWAQFADSVSNAWNLSPSCIYYDRADKEPVQDAKKSFNNRLNELADAEIDRDPSLLSRDRGKAATLMHGAVDRSDIYKSVELSLDRLISEHLSHVLAAGREIRKVEIGEEAAAEEERRGNISDEEYAKDAAARREMRERQKKQDEARKRREEEKEQLRAEAMEKEAELERLRKADERRRERKARDEKLEEERRMRIEEEEERRKHYEQRKKEEHECEKPSHRLKAEPGSRHRSVERVAAGGKESSQSPHPVKEEDTKAIAVSAAQIDEKAIEAAALEELLRESRELAAKSGSKSQVERSESLEPPHRKPHTLKPRSSNISPSKPADLRQPMKSEPIKPKLSFSATNVGRGATTQREPQPSQRTRSRSPTSAHHADPDYRQRSQTRTHPEDKHSQTQSSENKDSEKPRTSHRNPEPDYYKDDVQEASHRSSTITRQDTKERDPSEHRYHEYDYDKSDRHKYNHHDYDKHGHRSSGYSRSPSRRRSERDYGGDRERYRDHGRDYDRDRERQRDHERGRYREDRDRRYDRSRSPYKLADSRHDHEESRSVRSGQRIKSPVDIDRYVPSGGSHARDMEREKYRHRDYEVDARDEKYRHRKREPDLRDERHRDRESDHKDDRYRDRERERYEREDVRYRERHDDKDRDRERERYEREDVRYRERHDDKDRDRDRRDRDRDRDREKDRERDRRHHYDRGDYDRGRERRDDGHDRERGRGYVEIDRYVPGGRDDPLKARGRDRSR
ncbi:MAG: hypothetical protein Q9225_006232 [Loekoesia sp. 1 TL-2023]